MLHDILYFALWGKKHLGCSTSWLTHRWMSLFVHEFRIKDEDRVVRWIKDLGYFLWKIKEQRKRCCHRCLVDNLRLTWIIISDTIDTSGGSVLWGSMDLTWKWILTIILKKFIFCWSYLFWPPFLLKNHFFVIF